MAPGCGLPVANTSHHLTLSTARVTQLELHRAVQLVTSLPTDGERDLTVANAWACLTADASDEFFGKLTHRCAVAAGIPFYLLYSFFLAQLITIVTCESTVLPILGRSGTTHIASGAVWRRLL